MNEFNFIKNGLEMGKNRGLETENLGLEDLGI